MDNSESSYSVIEGEIVCHKHTWMLMFELLAEEVVVCKVCGAVAAFTKKEYLPHGVSKDLSPVPTVQTSCFGEGVCFSVGDNDESSVDSGAKSDK